MNMREIIDFFYDEARAAREGNEYTKPKYAKAQAIENVGSMINNVFHGKTIHQWLPNVHMSFMNTMLELDSNPVKNSMDEEEIEGYKYALEMLTLIADDYNIVL